METRKIQRSGTTYYIYLPASWCREHKITTNSTVHLEKSSKGNLLIEPKKTEANLSSLKFELNETSPEVINKMIIASYINPVKEFDIKLKQKLSSDQILGHKELLGGLELVDFAEESISCHASLALSDPDALLKIMIKRIQNITGLLKESPEHELIKRYEEEVDKSNIMVFKSIISILMYRKESKLKHVELFYIGLISRSLEQISDIVITLGKDRETINTVEKMMSALLNVLENKTQGEVISFIKSVEKLGNIEVDSLIKYKKRSIYANLGQIAEVLSDWLITEMTDKR
jgi:phosphate uptake regulator